MISTDDIEKLVSKTFRPEDFVKASRNFQEARTNTAVFHDADSAFSMASGAREAVRTTAVPNRNFNN